MDKKQAIVQEIVKNTHDVVTIYFTVDGGVFDYQAGQYISVYFDDTDVKTGKAYSLSSAPGDARMSITVKNIGLFSGKLHNLRVGDKVVVSLPYGFFNVKNDSPIVAIASGVGISPIWSIIYDELKSGREINLLCSNKTDQDIVFAGEIDELAKLGKIKVRHFITRQPDSKFTARRIVVDDLQEYLGSDYCFYICGSQDFVSAMWKLLATAGVDEKFISTETFFEN